MNPELLARRPTLARKADNDMLPGVVVLLIACFVGAVVWFGLAARKRDPPIQVVLKEYVTVVLPRLEKLYGPTVEYTPARVDRVLRETGVSTLFRAHAYALFGSHAAFRDHPACVGLDYEELRARMLLIHRRYVARPWAGGIVATRHFSGGGGGATQ